MKKGLALLFCAALVVGIAFGVNTLLFSQSSGPKAAPLDQLQSFTEKSLSSKQYKNWGVRLADDAYTVVTVVPTDTKEQATVNEATARKILKFYYDPGSITKAHITNAIEFFTKPLSATERNICPKFPGKATLDPGDIIVSTKLIIPNRQGSQAIVDAYAILSPTGIVKYSVLLDYADEDAYDLYWKNLCGK